MTATLALTVFVLAGGLALSVLVQSWAAYGRAALALRHRLSSSDDLRELRFTIREIRSPAPAAMILRPDFRPVSRPVPQPQAWRAAA